MAFLLLVPPLTLGKDRIWLFANVFWPALVLVFLYFRRRVFGVGGARSV